MHDTALAQGLTHFFADETARTIADFGCGLGLYVRDLRSAGFRVTGGCTRSPQCVSQGSPPGRKNGHSHT